VTAAALTSPAAAARTVTTVRTEGPGELLDRLPAEGALSWVRHGEGLVGWGEAARLEVSGPLALDEAADWWADWTDELDTDDALGVPGSGPVLFASIAFDPAVGTSVFVVPQVVVGRRDGVGWLTTVGDVDPRDVLLPERDHDGPPLRLRYADGALDPATWCAAVATAVERIDAGELEKVVLARDLLAFAENDIDVRWIAARLAANYAQCWTYSVDGLVGATPEMLVKREAGLATSRVLAGTIRRSSDADHDLNLAAALAQSSKDLEEHEYAVRSVARALTPFCSGMNVPDAPYVLQLPNVLHLATDITGVADKGVASLALAAALHPTAAVCGTPTDSARSLIAELEHLDRERYAGPVGWIDANGDGEWAIALRCGQVSETDPHQIRLFAGCGIVAGSDPAAELAESNAKLIPMRDSLG
jgi:menaquinone-specific isochorismate synthase